MSWRNKSVLEVHVLHEGVPDAFNFQSLAKWHLLEITFPLLCEGTCVGAPRILPTPPAGGLPGSGIPSQAAPLGCLTSQNQAAHEDPVQIPLGGNGKEPAWSFGLTNRTSGESASPRDSPTSLS